MGMSIGGIRFEGNRPSNCTSYGGMQVYHNGSVKKTGSRGGKSVWTGSGDVWVIFPSNQVGKHIFEVSGTVQTGVK